MSIPETNAPKFKKILKRRMTAKKHTSYTAKQAGFFLKIRLLWRKSVACEPHTASLPSFALRFQPHSRSFVWLLARTWIRKNTDRFAIYVQAWCTYKVIGETVVFLFIVCSDEERGDMKLLRRPCSRYLPCSPYSWRFMYGYRVLLHGHYTFLSTNCTANARQTNTAGLFWYRWLCTLMKPKKSYLKRRAISLIRQQKDKILNYLSSQLGTKKLVRELL